jgi:membrane-associated phospholipid phosphatase
MAEKSLRCIAMLLCLAAAPSAASAQDGDVPAARNFLKTISEGVKSVVSEESGALISAAAAVALLAMPFDETLTFSASNSTFLKASFDGWARMAGQEWVLGGGALATFVIGRATDHPKVSALGGDMMQAQLLAGATTFALKHAIRRARPDGEARSFPSGHAAGTFAAATVVQRHYGMKGAIPAFTAATLISSARLQANSHYATDIILGAAVGILSARAATFELGHRRVSVSPAAPRGGGLLISVSVQ